MKKLVLLVAVLFGLGGATMFAHTNFQETKVEITQDEFVKIEVADLPEAVAEALKKDYVDFTVLEAFVGTKDDAKIYKLVLRDAESNETVLLMNEKGEKIVE